MYFKLKCLLLLLVFCWSISICSNGMHFIYIFRFVLQMCVIISNGLRWAIWMHWCLSFSSAWLLFLYVCKLFVYLSIQNAFISKNLLVFFCKKIVCVLTSDLSKMITLKFFFCSCYYVNGIVFVMPLYLILLRSISE